MYRLLIVDDEIFIANAIMRNLQPLTLGFCRADCAYSVDEAKAFLQKQPVDIILCDIEMPDGSGISLLEWVKSYYPHIECIMLTCHAEFDYLRQAMRLGCMDYVLKPIEYEELKAVIKKAMDKIQWQKKLIENEDSQKRAYLDKLFKTLMNVGYDQHSDSLEDKVRHYVREHLMENISIQEIADYVSLSPAHLMKSFRKKTGISVLSFITFERLNGAKALLLNTELAVSEVALSVGYSDYSYFTRLFKKELGMTPLAYRKSFRQ
ncbi:MAG: AraC family transcriptional regulator [Clostridiales bacterium]|nr:AraC family transcriptional regulator [Clostridiales bacterium]